MPELTLNVKGLTTMAKKLSIVTCYMLLVTFLSGCTAIGYSKPAALQVTSTPEASVFLDGKHIGKTPFYSDQLKAGNYTVKVTVSDATYVDKITLTEGTLTVVNRDLSSNFLASAGENLSLVPNQKGFFVISWPEGSDITVDGKYVAKTPFLMKGLDDGEHRVLISKTGYLEREFVIKSSPKYQLLANVTLASQIAKGVGSTQTAQKPQAKQVEILSAPGGFVRVRQEPNALSTEIGRINTQDTVEVIQQTDNWLQVKFEVPAHSGLSPSGSKTGESGKLGWISTQYTKEVE